MSVSKWAYTPEMCDGDICVYDCDLCDKPKIAKIHNTATMQVQIDCIKREDAIKKFAGVTLIECDKTTAESPYSLSAAEKFFTDIPSADVVEVVRCKDCKYYYHDAEYGYDWCNRTSGVFRVKKDSFCSYGERAEA